jgi:hypothetical protein
MKRQPSRALSIAMLALLATTAGGDPTPQPQMQFAQGLQGTFNADWEGVAGRTYFTQFSMNLVDWHFAPFIDFGDGGHHRGIESDADKLFLRLLYGEFAGVNSLNDALMSDMDEDGLTSLFEVMHGFDPLTANANADGEEDGLLLTSEQQYGTSPHRKDHPAVKLSVVIGN